jgi:hypothetical protein
VPPPTGAHRLEPEAGKGKAASIPWLSTPTPATTASGSAFKCANGLWLAPTPLASWLLPPAWLDEAEDEEEEEEEEEE